MEDITQEASSTEHTRYEPCGFNLEFFEQFEESWHPHFTCVQALLSP